MSSHLALSTVRLVLLGGALSLCACGKIEPLAGKKEAPSAASSPSAPTRSAEPTPLASVPLPANFPALTELWTEKEIERAAALLAGVAANDPRKLPSSATSEGRAFFGTLRRAAAESYRLPSLAKVSFGNHYSRLLPLYVAAARNGQKLDREIALLVALEFELADHFVQDRSFTTKDPDNATFNPNGGNVLVYFQQGSERIDSQLRERLLLLREKRLFSDESRALALSYVARHLPTIARVLKLKDLRPLLVESARLETVETNRAYYQTLLGSVWIE